MNNKANLRNFIAATGLVILLKLAPNRIYFSQYDLENWGMTLKNNRALLLYYIKLCASFQIHQWIKTGVTVRKRSIQVKIDDFLSRVTLKFDGWPWKTIGHLFYATLSFVHNFKNIDKFKRKLQSGKALFGSKSAIFCPMQLWIWQDRWPWITIGGVRKRPIWVKIDSFLSRVTLKFHIWPWRTIGHLCYFKLCASFRSHWWIQTGITVRKRPIWVKIDDFFLAVWPWNLTDDLEKQ